MASAQAQIEIAIKNVRALDNLSTKLNKLILVNKKLVTSINKLDTTFKKISKSGLNNLEQGAKKASKGVLTTTDSIEALTGRLKGLKREGGAALDLVGNRFKTIGKGITLQPFKGLIDEISKVPYVVKRSFQDTRTFLEILSKGGKDIVGLVSGLGALIVNVKNLGVAARTNLTSLGTILDNNANKAENFLNKMVLGIKMQNTAFALAKNTALAQQKSLPATLLRNTLRSQAGRSGTGFGDFSQGIGEYNPYQIATPTPRYGAGRIGPIHPTQHYALQSNPYMGQFDNATQKSIARHTKHLAKINKHTGKTAALLASQQAMAGLSQYGAPIGPVAPTFGQRAGVMANNLGFGKNANPRGVFASRGGIGGRIRGAGSSALIGGAFPALFGQGGAASIGGGLGGALGGALGGGLGFGLSLVGTVIGQKVQEAKDFQKAIDKLNISIEATGGVSKFAAKDIKELAQNFGITKEEALQAAGAFAQFDAVSRIALTKTFGNQQTFDTLAALKDNKSTLEGIKTLSTTIGIEKAKETLEVLKQKGAYEAQLTLVKEISAVERSKQIDNAKKITTEDRLAQMRKGFEILGDVVKEGKVNLLEKSFAEIKADERVQKLIDSFADSDEKARELLKTTKELNKEFEKIAKLKGPEDELAKLLDPVNQLISAATAIGNAFSSSFQGIITGSMSAQQALANFFRQTADSFAKMAADILAAQIRAKIVGMFANAFASSFNPASAIGPNADISGAALDAGRSYSDMDKIMNGGLQTVIGAEGGYWSGGLKPFASGGYATKPTLGLVGEAGEDEYIIPASKMAASMQRYSAGARGEAVIPGTGSSYAGGGAGGSTTVNYSGPILNFNSEEFVPKSAVGQIIATATSRGARAGENRTLSTLRNSRSARSRLGM